MINKKGRELEKHSQKRQGTISNSSILTRHPIFTKVINICIWNPGTVSPNEKHVVILHAQIIIANLLIRVSNLFLLHVRL